ncbi:DUF3010 domain-containing protein [Aliidiomarina iranensis]|uniref:DUF3010 domain-containing protein n=1 Tax=Aliidiomarina iranensis TaxID=1434071 RepID=A0A432VZT8_9GAMM|nr:DUF3010 family protein [Aliidiomarina iranensis]RUO22267.1 DUF3010 domain-containing protein [Aliidiomarina iranensis]
MRVCGIEIKSNEAIICLMEMNDGLVQIPDCRQVRFQLLKDHDAEQVRRFQFTFRKLIEDYKIERLIIKERMQKGKFSGSAVGFKIEAALQLIDSVETHLLANSMQKDIIKRNPIPVDYADTGLKVFQETAFSVAYAYLMSKEYNL